MKSIVRSLFEVKSPQLEREVFGLKFPNPVGLAAGFDKNGGMYKSLAHFGFGAIEIGTVTPVGQPGNPKPRLFRLPKDEALVNRMGFNNDGVEIVAERLVDRPTGLIVGGNIGKNKVTPNEKAVDDYEACFKVLYPFVDYFVVNVSSPNTPNLRDLQEKEPLIKLLTALMVLNRAEAKQKPILLKIAPDLTDGQLDDIVEIVTASRIAGLICTNTTISRANLVSTDKVVENIGAGGLSGKPVKDRSTEVIRHITQRSNGKIPIIGVGGIHSADDAIEKLQAGASLIQIYTGFVYEGPGLIKSINEKVLELGL